MKVLVTGAGGLVGGEVVRQLHILGHQVVGVYRKTTMDAMTEAVVPVLMDLSEEVLHEGFLDELPDALVHCAAVFPRAFGGEADRQCAEINRCIDDNVLAFSKQVACKTIYISSTAVYGQGSDVKVEDCEPNPDGFYAAGKLQSEGLFLESPAALCLRLNAPYGPRQTNNTVLKMFIAKAVNGEVLNYYGSGARTQDFTHCRDVAAAVCAGLFSGRANGVINIASSQEISMKALAELVVAQLDGATPSRVEASESPDPQEASRSRISIEKAKSQLGWSPHVSLQEGVKEWLEFEMMKAAN